MSGRGRAEGATSGGREGRILLGREKSPCTVIVGEVAGEDVACLHAYPGYAANWKRPTNDTRTEFDRDRGCCRRTKAPPRFGASDSGQRGLKELFVRVLVAPSFIEVSGQEVTEPFPLGPPQL